MDPREETAEHLRHPTPDQLKALLAGGELLSVSRLLIESEPPSRGAGRSKAGLVQELCKAGPLPALRALHLQGGNFGPKSMEHLGKAKNLPALDELVLVYAQIGDEGLRVLAQSKGPLRLRALEIQDSFSGEALSELLAAPVCERLEVLRLNSPGQAVHAALNASPALPRLRQLALRGSSMDDDSSRQLARGLAGGRLERLEVTNHGFSDSVLADLIGGTPNLTAIECGLRLGEGERTFRALAGRSGAALTSLGLRYATVPADAAAVLARSGALSALRSLDLTGYDGEGEGLIALLGATRSLERLTLKEAKVSPEALGRALSQAGLTKLETLTLRKSELPDAALSALAGSRDLEALDLSETGLGEGALARLAKLDLPRLRVLDLTGRYSETEHFSDDALRAFAARGWHSLEELGMGWRGVSDAGLLACLDPKLLPELRVIDASSGKVEDAAIDAIIAGPRPRNLERIDLSNSPASFEARYRMKQQIGIDYLTS